MDRITENQLKEFVASHNFESLDQAEQFEHFANYSVLFGELPDTIDLDDVHVADDGNVGIDGIAIIVNGALVTDIQEVDQLVKQNGYLDADFIFVQSKTSDGTNMGDINTFLYAVQQFFATKPKVTFNDMVKELIQVKNHMYDRHVSKMTHNPNVGTYFVYTGKWSGDKNLQGVIDTNKESLSQTNLFNEIDFTPVDAAALQKLYRASMSKATAKFTFKDKVTLDQQREGVEEAHFGLIPVAEFLKLISDDAGNIKKSLFYDNVRDFQGDNDVNKSIKATLRSSDRTLFPLLNNGITIIASTVRPTGNVFTVEDYQIVNGCQTSHVLHQERAQLSTTLYVPIKIIATTDETVVNKIIHATNSQTEVKPEQLYALSEFQKRLEEFYGTFEGDLRLYYERRSKQYANDGAVGKARIVTIQQQMRAFLSMFLEEPHRGHYSRSAGSTVGTSMFAKGHLLEPYYVSAFAQYRLEYLFRTGKVSRSLKPARYHILLVVRKLIDATALPSMDSKKMRTLCDAILGVVRDDEKFVAVIVKAASVIQSACGKKELNRSLTKTAPFTKDVLKRMSLPRKKW